MQNDLKINDQFNQNDYISAIRQQNFRRNMDLVTL